MSQPRRALTRADIMDMADYAKVRKERRAAVTALKRNRRLAVGPFATFHFECFETMWMQVHEMLHIERGGEEQIAGELEAYNPLIPRGRRADRNADAGDRRPGAPRARALPPGRGRGHHQAGGRGSTVAARPIEDEVARTSEDGKTSSIHFLRFPFQPAAAAAFRTPHACCSASSTRLMATSPSCRRRPAPPSPRTWTTAGMRPTC